MEAPPEAGSSGPLSRCARTRRTRFTGCRGKNSRSPEGQGSCPSHRAPGPGALATPPPRRGCSKDTHHVGVDTIHSTSGGHHPGDRQPQTSLGAPYGGGDGKRAARARGAGPAQHSCRRPRAPPWPRRRSSPRVPCSCVGPYSAVNDAGVLRAGTAVPRGSSVPSDLLPACSQNPKPQTPPKNLSRTCWWGVVEGRCPGHSQPPGVWGRQTGRGQKRPQELSSQAQTFPRGWMLAPRGVGSSHSRRLPPPSSRVSSQGAAVPVGQRAGPRG